MSPPACLDVDDTLLRGWTLPLPDGDGDKEHRGRVLVVAGSREMPGAAILAATAALRAGAGKLVVATPQSAAGTVAMALPEARVIALPESPGGSPVAEGAELLQPLAGSTGALLVGPGMTGGASTLPFVAALVPLFRETTVVLDALAMDVLRDGRAWQQPLVLTPHAGEMAHLTGRAKEEVTADPHAAALQQARTWGAVVALKGANTCVAAPDGRAWLHCSETPGLGTSGSGDVLAGVIAGLAARGAPPEQAAVWGVALHARAGQALAARTGSIGYLARELPAEIPRLMHGLCGEG